MYTTAECLYRGVLFVEYRVSSRVRKFELSVQIYLDSNNAYGFSKHCSNKKTICFGVTIYYHLRNVNHKKFSTS